jgi:ribonucleoside-triphosphate reductase (thioredoxin)
LSNAVLPTDYQTFIHLSRYARWREDLKRRETWPETVERYISFFKARNPSSDGALIPWDELQSAILNLEVMPSMRALMTAGPALERDNVAGYNCWYREVDELSAFDEILYVLMCGTGVGFSVERQVIKGLPPLPDEFFPVDHTIVVADSKIGWASSLRTLLSHLWVGEVPKWDVSRVRPSGARLRTMGGRASGPQPLVDLFEYCCRVIPHAAGRRLNSLECHDLVCKIADIVVVGGVRRSALLSLSNLSDERMRDAKAGAWWELYDHRKLANNSVAYTEKPEMGAWMAEWMSLYKSKSGERGVFSRVASQKQAAKNGRRNPNYEFGTNPCSEIILRSKQFCNLTEVVVRATDSHDELERKVRLATILGTIQATLTKFRYLSKASQRITEEEALLGVSLTGIMDHPLLSDASAVSGLPYLLERLRATAVDVNAEYAAKLGINQSVAVTCVKPSGTVSQLVDSASGIHPRYAPFYLRTVRADKNDPLSRLMRDAGCYVENDVTKPEATDVFYFPSKSPDNAVTRNDRSALEQLELCLIYQRHWCEHKPSITVYVREHEWMDVGAWMYRNFDEVSGVSFLPHADDAHSYKQAPYQDITEIEYNEWKAKSVVVDWSKIGAYEGGVDMTSGTRELACSAGICEFVDLEKQ